VVDSSVARSAATACLPSRAAIEFLSAVARSHDDVEVLLPAQKTTSNLLLGREVATAIKGIPDEKSEHLLTGAHLRRENSTCSAFTGARDSGWKDVPAGLLAPDGSSSSASSCCYCRCGRLTPSTWAELEVSGPSSNSRLCHAAH
jgi:hypothetical protein